MALKPLQARMQPYGQFDGYDSEITSFLGGEVVTFTSVVYQGTDKAAKDVDDGYSGTTSKVRPAVTLTLASGNRPLFLADEGNAGYGTLFGEVVGAAVGQTSTGGTRLGPHSAEGPGKITLWDGPGMYAVTLDAVDTTASTGLVPGNADLTPGDPLYATAAGKLTPDSGSAFENLVVGRFVEFGTDGSLVKTPNTLVQALNSPTGSTAGTVNFDHVVLHFNVEL